MNLHWNDYCCCLTAFLWFFPHFLFLALFTSHAQVFCYRKHVVTHAGIHGFILHFIKSTSSTFKCGCKIVLIKQVLAWVLWEVKWINIKSYHKFDSFLYFLSYNTVLFIKTIQLKQGGKNSSFMAIYSKRQSMMRHSFSLKRSAAINDHWNGSS